MLTNSLSLAAGRLRHTVALEQPSTVPDSFGQPVESWTTVWQGRAAIETVTARELYQSGQFTDQISHIVTMRWPGPAVPLATGMRVSFGSHAYKVQAVNNILERNRVVELLVLELNSTAAR